MNVSDSSPNLRARVRQTLDRLRDELLQERNDAGHWVGGLSPSSLSTATAVSAMSAVLLHAQADADSRQLRERIGRGIDYLAGHQNSDGGFGDTDRSHSNIATSYLVLAASTLADRSAGRSLDESQRDRLEKYIVAAGRLDGLRRRYGKDKTFVVPIMANLAIAGLVSWDEVAALPFEAAVFPQSMYRFLGMPVVSYAVPALVAIGQSRHFHGKRTWLPLRMMRAASIGRSMKVLRRMQPDSGGYLEATPLTAFVVMNLATTGRGDCEVARHGMQFLIDSMTDDGSWPIDTNLATWLTSLAIHALASDPQDDGSWCSDSLVDWHLACQHTRRHPFTGAEPGGWGWSDLSGAVPDSDDTPAAIIALRHLADRTGDRHRDRIVAAAGQGERWLIRLQNRDGGWPTFCRGWGKLPFDRSSTDLTAHAIRAFSCRLGFDENAAEIQRATERARRFLQRQQRDDGSWLPLWFGNQDRPDEANPVYGTSRVLLAAEPLKLDRKCWIDGCEYLTGCQNEDGGWGGGPSLTDWLRGGGHVGAEITSSVEETALAVDALLAIQMAWRNLSPSGGVQLGSGASFPAAGNDCCEEAIIRGIEFLLRSVGDGRHRVPWPIGFYFAKLWYHERLYPLIFAATALGNYLRLVVDDYDDDRELASIRAATTK